MYVADGDILILITLSASILVFTAVIGFSGTILNSRAILAIYTLLLWPSLISILIGGYTSYKRHTFKLDHKLNRSRSQYFTPLGRVAYPRQPKVLRVLLTISRSDSFQQVLSSDCVSGM
ncbi:hypothetical protein MPER_04160 [Moniliophthora perniciosa FA553]|nr:hypothetical protein MPER_04160 [Moniliophthora perniciosa FA553]